MMCEQYFRAVKLEKIGSYFVCCGGHNVAILERISNNRCSNKSTDVSHIHHEKSTNSICNLHNSESNLISKYEFLERRNCLDTIKAMPVSRYHCDLSHAGIVKIPGISTSTSNDEFWSKENSCFLQHVIINKTCLIFLKIRFNPPSLKRKRLKHP